MYCRLHKDWHGSWCIEKELVKLEELVKLDKLEKMKALVKRFPEPGIWMEEVPMPEVGVNDVLIKVTKAD